MCTVSILSTENGYLIGGNRDERKSRKKGLPPSIHHENEIPYLSPIDADAGGTWIAVNSYGFSCCLLNRYSGNFEQDFESVEPISRGKIIPKFMNCKTTQEGLDVFNNYIETKKFRPFTLLLIDYTQEVSVLRIDWDGKNTHISNILKPPLLFVSSGLYQKEVDTVRQEIFRDLITKNATSIELLKKLHSYKIPENGGYSIAMELDIVQTVSCTIIQYNHEISMIYTDGIPSKNSDWQKFILK